MRFLFDQNLSRHLVCDVAVEYPDSRHVTAAARFAATEDEALLVLPTA